MKKNILVVDDSALMRKAFCDIINASSGFEVIDVCKDGDEAIVMLRKNSYDAVILDINMPKVNGIEVLEMARNEHINTKIVMIGVASPRDADIKTMLLKRGAVDYMNKPDNVIEARSLTFRGHVISVLTNVCKDNSKVAISRLKIDNPKNRIVAIACSTGGPKALQEVLPLLSKDLPVPVVLVQHMPQGFTEPLCERLDSISEIKISQAEDGEILEPGHVYIAPGGKHMEIKKNNKKQHYISLNTNPAIGGLRPCANVMYESLRDSGYDEIICVVMTGMGQDGTDGIKSLIQKKPVHTIAQDAKSCVVYGMPKALVDLGVADEVIPLNTIAKTINKILGVI